LPDSDKNWAIESTNPTLSNLITIALIAVVLMTIVTVAITITLTVKRIQVFPKKK